MILSLLSLIFDVKIYLLKTDMERPEEELETDFRTEHLCFFGQFMFKTPSLT
jgi:hypothetical protein